MNNISLKKKEYYQRNKETIKRNRLEYYQRNKEIELQKYKLYYETNRDKRIQYFKDYHLKKKYQNNPFTIRYGDYHPFAQQIA